MDLRLPGHSLLIKLIIFCVWILVWLGRMSYRIVHPVGDHNGWKASHEHYFRNDLADILQMAQLDAYFIVEASGVKDNS